MTTSTAATRTTTDSWRRHHSGSRTMALAIWLDGRCEASIYEPPGLSRAPQRVCYETTDEARAAADRQLKDAYPHECDADACGPWVSFACGDRLVSPD